MFFWVFPRRQIVVGRRFGTLCQFHLQRLGVEYSTPSLWRWNWHRVPKRRPSTIWRRGNTQKNIYNLLTYLPTPWSRALLEKLISFQLVKKLPAFYRTRGFITTFTSAPHLSLSWARPIQSIPPHPTSLRSVLILSSHLRLGLPSDLFPSSYPTRTLCTPLLSRIRATCPTHIILLDLISRKFLGEEYRSLSSSLEKHWNIKFHKNRLVGTELFHADRRTGRHDEANSCCS